MVVEAVMVHVSYCFWISSFPQIQCLLLRHSGSALQSGSPEWFLYEVSKSNSQIKNLGPGGWWGMESQGGCFPGRWMCRGHRWWGISAKTLLHHTGKQPVSVCCLWHQRIYVRNLKCHIGDLYEPPACPQRYQTTVIFSSLLILNIQGTCLFWDFLVSQYL